MILLRECFFLNRENKLIIYHTAADPGFPVGAGAYPFAKFSEKLHEIEKFLGRRGRALEGGWCHLRSGNDMHTLV